MKKYFILLILFPLIQISAQRIGETIVEKPSIDYPDKMWGMDIMFSDGGFGLGTFYRNSFSESLTGFIDFSISESKDEREIEYVDYFGQIRSVGKKNRAFLFPVNAGLQYRIFKNQLTDNLRPYINAGIGPTFVVTTPYEEEFFSSFKHAKLTMAAGGYIGFGANFGLSKKNLIGLNFRYYFIYTINKGIERLENNYDNFLGGFFLTINIGLMFN